MTRNQMIATALAAGLAISSVALAQEAKPTGQPQPVAPRKVDGTLTPAKQPPVKGENLNFDDGTGATINQQLPGSSKAEDSPLTWDAFEFSWGDIPDTAEVTHDFKFKNNTDKKVVIREARGSCGCTVPTLTKKDYAPGEEGIMTVKFNPQHRKGPQQKTVTVVYEDNTLTPTLLNLTSNVKPLVILDPPKLYVNDVEHGKGKTSQLKVSGRGADFKVTGVDFSNPYLTVVVGEPVAVDIDGEQLMTSTIDFTVSPEAPIGNLEVQAKLHTTEPKQATLDFNFLATVVGDLFASPQAISIREFNPGFPFMQQVVIDSRAAKPFNITSVTVESDQVPDAVADIETIAGSGKNIQVVKVFGKLPDAAGPVSGTLIVKTDSEDGDLRVPFFANVRRVAGSANAITK